MWQTVVILLVLLVVAIYLVRHYLRIYRAEDPTCGGCAGCCPQASVEVPGLVAEGVAFKDCSCAEGTTNDRESNARAGKSSSLGLPCQDVKKHDHKVCH
jgi:hypothetical protein